MYTVVHVFGSPEDWVSLRFLVLVVELGRLDCAKSN